MAGDNNRTVEERLRELEAARRDMAHLLRTAAGLLKGVRHAEKLEDIKRVLLAVAGVLEAAGREQQR